MSLRVVGTFEQSAAAIYDFRRECHASSYKYIVIDCEYYSDGSDNVALISLYHDEFMLLIRTAKFEEEDGLPHELRQMMGDPEIVKIGFNIAQIVADLDKDFDLVIRSTIELQEMAEYLRYVSWDNVYELYDELFDKSLEDELDRDNCYWEKGPLTKSQKYYTYQYLESIYDIFVALRNQFGKNDDTIDRLFVEYEIV